MRRTAPLLLHLGLLSPEELSAHLRVLDSSIVNVWSSARIWKHITHCGHSVPLLSRTDVNSKHKKSD